MWSRAGENLEHSEEEVFLPTKQRLLRSLPEDQYTEPMGLKKRVLGKPDCTDKY